MSQEQNPFHAGELAIQERAGVREQVAGFGSRAIRTFMPDQHREFFALLPLLLVGSLDADGYPSASVLWGPRLRPFAGTDPPAHRQPAASGRSAGGQSRGWHPPRHPRPGMADTPPQPHEWTGPGAGRKGFHGRRRAVLRQLSQVHPGAQPSARLQDRKSRVAGRRTRSALAVAGLAQRYAVHRQPACRPTPGAASTSPIGAGRRAFSGSARMAACGCPTMPATACSIPSATCSRILAAASCSSISTMATCCTCTPRPSCSGRVRSHPSPGPPAPSACWRCAPQAGAGGAAACRWHSASPSHPLSSCR